MSSCYLLSFSYPLSANVHVSCPSAVSMSMSNLSWDPVVRPIKHFTWCLDTPPRIMYYSNFSLYTCTVYFCELWNNISLGLVPLAKIYGIQKTTRNFYIKYKQIINTNSFTYLQNTVKNQCFGHTKNKHLLNISYSVYGASVTLWYNRLTAGLKKNPAPLLWCIFENSL